MAISKFNLDEFEFDIEESSGKYCKKCKTKNLLEAKFCLECGSKEFVSSLSKKSNEKYCVKCKTKLESKAKFCYNCGSSDFVSSLDDADNYFVKELDSKWQEELDKVNKKINKANKELEELKLKKEEYLTKISKSKKSWEDKINNISNDNKNITNKANSYKDESSGYVKKIAKLKEQVSQLETKYNDLIKNKENNNKNDFIYEMFFDPEQQLRNSIFQYVFNKSPQQMYNSALKLEKENKHEQAFLVYQTAAEKDHKESQNKLGCIYYERAVKNKESVFGSNYKEALKWFTKSAENGYFHGMINTGRCYLEAKGTSCDEEEAIKWFEKAARANHAIKSDAYYYLGRCFEELYHFEKESVSYYEKSDCYESYKRLAYIYYNGVFKVKNCTKAYDYAIKAYRDGTYDPNGEVGTLLGKLILGFSGVKRDEKKAYEYFAKAAFDNQNTEAYYQLAQCYLMGYGVAKNKTKAKKYYEFAAKRGHSLAIKKLKEL